MRIPLSLCVAVWVAVAGPRAGAQTADPAAPRPTPPSGPFLNPAPDVAAWTIVRHSIPGLNSQPPEAVARKATVSSPAESVTSVTKANLIRHAVRKLSTGEQEEIWYEHSNRITMESVWKIPMLEGATSAPNLPQGPDFPEFAWISAANFVASRDYQGVTYLLFESQVIEGDAVMAKAYGTKLQPTFKRAYIRADTRLPWLLQTGDNLHLYTFQAPPATALEVPPAYQAMFDTYEKKKAEAARRPIMP